MIMPQLEDDMRAWRQHFHRWPELGFQETGTAAFIAERLAEFGIEEIATGVGGTGVVATIRAGQGNRAVGLRADMDALQIEQAPGAEPRSEVPGTSHACGHDGHIAMLLGAARHLAQTRDFDGIVHFIFQPAEEWGQGMQAMLDDGLLARFPMDETYGLHNMPGLPVGSFATRAGPLMAAEDLFEIRVTGSGGHSSRPHEARDALVASCAVVQALQSIVSRRIDPAELAVLSVTEIDTDGTRNVLASTAVIKGDCRSYAPSVSTALEAAIDEVAAQAAGCLGCSATMTYSREFVPLHNTGLETSHAVAVAETLGPTDPQTAPIGASEDFARLLAHVPGNFMFVGNGASEVLHHPGYAFNDDVLGVGAAYLVEIAKARLSPI